MIFSVLYLRKGLQLSHQEAYFWKDFLLASKSDNCSCLILYDLYMILYDLYMIKLMVVYFGVMRGEYLREKLVIESFYSSIFEYNSIRHL